MIFRQNDLGQNDFCTTEKIIMINGSVELAL